MNPEKQPQPQNGPQAKTFDEGLLEARRLIKMFSAFPALHWVGVDDPHNAVHQKPLSPELCLRQGKTPCQQCKGRVDVVHTGDKAFVLCKFPFPSRNPLEVYGLPCDEEETPNPLTSMV